MKLRTGFVSNSSSSSFILAVQEDYQACPHCGRKDISLYDLIQDSNRFSYSDETEIHGRNKEEVVRELEKRIEGFENILEDYSLKAKRGQKETSWGGNIAEYIKEYTQYIKETQDLITKVQAAKGNVFSCNVNYHDDLINGMIKDLEAAGRLTILEKENE